MTLQVGDLIPIGGSGNVKKSEVLEGKTYSSDEGVELVGEMPNRGNLNKTILLDDYKGLEGKQTVLNVAKGYYTGGKIEVEKLPDDTSGSPGNKVIKVGYKGEGYFGVVPASELITGSALTSRVGVTEGTAQHSNTPWHKFSWKGKVLFIAQKTIRHSISWDHLNSKNLIYGGKTIEINGVKYKVRLVKGALTDPSKYSDSDLGAKGSEWNRLVAPLSVQRKNNSWSYTAYMESDLQDWGTYISDSELTVRTADGRFTWCQEVGGDGSANRVFRGYLGVSYSGTRTSSDTNSNNGWRPVLEVVE